MTTDFRVRTGKNRVPATKKAEIERAIALHIRSHGNSNWCMLREHPDFAPWIGKASGEAGRRAFYRWKKHMLRATAKGRSRPRDGQAVNDDQQAWAAELAHSAALAGAAVVPSRAQIMRHGPLIGHSIANLIAALQTGFDDIERIRAVALTDDPSGLGGQIATNPELLLKAVRTLARLTETAKGLLDRYYEISSQEAFQQDLLPLIDEVLGQYPELRTKLVAGLADLVNRHGGGLTRAA